MATTKHISSKVCYTLVSVCLSRDYVPVPAGPLAGPDLCVVMNGLRPAPTGKTQIHTQCKR